MKKRKYLSTVVAVVVLLAFAAIAYGSRWAMLTGSG